MKTCLKSGIGRGWDAGCAVALLLILILAIAKLDGASSLGSTPVPAKPKVNLSTPGERTLFRSGGHCEIRNYFMDFAGDHSLAVATVTEQPSVGYAKYTVQLRLASGAEQSVILRAPPGGLQVEMHDMTGDKIPNDVVLRPSLIRWLPTVLVNDGHEHFKVAISGTDPGFFSSNEDLGSRRHDAQIFALLLTSGFKAVPLSNARLFDAQLRECLLSSFTQTVSNRSGHALSSGRAPPLVTAI